MLHPEIIHRRTISLLRKTGNDFVVNDIIDSLRSDAICGLLHYLAAKKDKQTRQCVKGEDRNVATDRKARQPLSDTEHRVQLKRALIASTIGTTIEWYDFLLYSTVTGLVFAKLFFPDSDP
jgi:hypothetical protein